MKNKRNTLKLLPLLLLVTFASCKKNDNNPDDQKNGIDITKYYIVGKISLNNIKQPYLITFDPNAKSNSIVAGVNAQSSYTYKDGTLTLDYGGGDKNVFKIENEAITSYDGVDDLQTFSLQKLPESNQLSGNTYSGGWATPGSMLLTLAKFKFNASQYGETSFGDPVINKDYTLIKNVAATSNTGANGILTFFVLIDGKLEGGRYNPTTEKYSYGTFSKL